MFHREGQTIILTTFFLVVTIVLTTEFFVVNDWLRWGLQIVSVLVLVLILQFFRNPKRGANNLFDEILAPVDGKVVVIEEVMETEYFNEKRMQVSIFMSPINVHVTRYPISGTIKYSKYHPGKYLVAWHPKSSTDNERTTVVINTPNLAKYCIDRLLVPLPDESLTMQKKVIVFDREKMQVLLNLVLGLTYYYLWIVVLL